MVERFFGCDICEAGIRFPLSSVRYNSNLRAFAGKGGYRSLMNEQKRLLKRLVADLKQDVPNLESHCRAREHRGN